MLWLLSSVPVCTWGLLIRQAFDLSILNPLTFRRVALLTSEAVFLPPIPLFLPDKITPGLYIDQKAECQMQPTPVQGQTLNPYEWVPVLSSVVGSRWPEALSALSAEPGDKHRGLSSLLYHQMTSSRTSPVCWCCTFVPFPLLPLPVNRWMAWIDPYTELSQTHLLEAVYSGIWTCKWEPRFLCFKPSPAQGMVHCVTWTKSLHPYVCMSQFLSVRQE